MSNFRRRLLMLSQSVGKYIRGWFGNSGWFYNNGW